MARRLRIRWQADSAVDGLLEVPQLSSDVGVLLAHGAGVGQRHWFMEHARRGLAAHGLVVLTFDYAYTAAGRKAPDRMDKLLAVHRAAADRLRDYASTVVLGGKSMGGRVGSHLAGDEGWPAAGLVYLGYPLVPLGKGTPRPTDHLERIAAPQLFLAGSRDRLSPPATVGPLARRLPNAEFIEIAGGDHSFNVPKAAGRSREEVLDGVIEHVAHWIERAVASQPGLM